MDFIYLSVIMPSSIHDYVSTPCPSYTNLYTYMYIYNPVIILLIIIKFATSETLSQDGEVMRWHDLRIYFL